jgi:hypothetical protein
VSLELGQSDMAQPFKLDNLLQHFRLEGNQRGKAHEVLGGIRSEICRAGRSM